MPCRIGWVGRQRLYDFRDDFDPDVDPNWTDEGVNGSVVDPTRYLTASGGKLILDGVTGAGYKIRRVPGLTQVRLGFDFSTGTSDADTAVGLVASHKPLSAGLGGPTGIGLNSVHLSLSPLHRSVNYYNGSLSAAVDTNVLALSADTAYEVEMKIEAGTLVVTGPSGTEAMPAGWEALWGDTIYVECKNDDLAHKLPRLLYAWAKGDDTIELPSPSRIKPGNGELRVGGEFMVDERDGRVLAAQLAGYGAHNPGEPIVEFIYDTTGGDADISGDLDGFYLVVKVDVDYVKLAAGLFSWDVELVALPGRRSVLVEIESVGNVRTNGLGATGDPWVAFPEDPLIPDCYALDGGTTPTTGTVVTNEGATPSLAVVASTGDDYLYDGTLRYRTGIDEFRVGACAVEVTFDGGETWHPIPGDQIPDEAANWLGGWRITNGYTRVSSTSYGLKVELFSGGVWETQLFDITSGLVELRGSLSIPTVYTNTLDLVTVHLTGSGLYTVDLTLRRGAPFVEVVAATGDGATAPWTITPYPAVAADTVTAGADADAANADGNKWAIRSPLALTVDTGTGETDLTTDANLFPFALAVHNADLISGVTLTEAYFAANYTTQEVVTG